MEEIRVKSLMSPYPGCLPVDATLAKVASEMVEKSLSCMVLSDEEKHPQGIITERDLVRVLIASQQELGLLERPAGEFMSAPIVTVGHEETLYEALVVARTERVRHLPVVDEDDCMVGMVTQTHLANAHFHVIEIQSEIIEKSIARQTRDLVRANAELQSLSMEDHLLDIGNRRAMEVDLEHTHAAYKRYERPYGIVLLDVDYFKKYNDYYGHAAGDQALQMIASFLKETIRDADRLYRYGGEELLLLLPETQPDKALEAANRLVRGLAEGKLPHEESPLGRITISAGVTCAVPGQPMETWKQVAELADKGLYQAKEAGRNQAVLQQPTLADVTELNVVSS